MNENVEHMIDRRREQVLGQQDYDWRVARRLEVREWARADVCGAITCVDEEHIKRAVPGKPVKLIPAGSDHLGPNGIIRAKHSPASNGSFRITFLGNYSWEPSLDAALYLVDEIWPLIATINSQAILTLGGADAPRELVDAVSRAERVLLTGPLDSVLPLLSSSDLFLCPLRFGGGVKIKIIEALYCGCPIVCTPIALQGLPVEVQKATLQGSSARHIAAIVIDLFNTPAKLSRLREAAVETAASLPRWKQAAELMRQAWLDTVSLKKQSTNKYSMSDQAPQPGSQRTLQWQGKIHKCC
jgi:glycosyltransferase involved in cell wall biosynthesis